MKVNILVIRLVALFWGLCLLAASGMAPAAEHKLVLQGGSPAPNVNYLPIYIAQREGYFKHEGLDVEVRYGRGASLAAQLVGSGQADISSMTFDPVILGYAKGLRGKFFYQYATSTIYYLAIPEKSALKGAADLANKKIGVSSLGSSSIPIAKFILRGAGVDPSSVTFVPVGTGNQAALAIRDHKVDALSLWNAPYATLETMGLRFKYIQSPKLDGIGNAGYFASEKVLKDRPQDLIGFARGIAKATVFILTNPQAAVQIYWQVNPNAKQGATEKQAMERGVKELEFIAKSYRLTSRPVKEYGYIINNQVQSYIDVLKSERDLKKAPTASEIATNQFIKKANDFDVNKIKEQAEHWQPKH